MCICDFEPSLIEKQNRSRMFWRLHFIVLGSDNCVWITFNRMNAYYHDHICQLVHSSYQHTIINLFVCNLNRHHYICTRKKNEQIFCDSSMQNIMIAFWTHSKQNREEKIPAIHLCSLLAVIMAKNNKFTIVRKSNWTTRKTFSRQQIDDSIFGTLEKDAFKTPIWKRSFSNWRLQRV